MHAVCITYFEPEKRIVSRDEEGSRPDKNFEFRARKISTPDVNTTSTHTFLNKHLCQWMPPLSLEIPGSSESITIMIFSTPSWPTDDLFDVHFLANGECSSGPIQAT